MRLHPKFDNTISFEGQVNDYLYTTSLYQVTSAYSFYDLMVLNFRKFNYSRYMSTDMNSLLAYASTSEEILNQLNKSMYSHRQKTCDPPTHTQQAKICYFRMTLHLI